MSQPISRPAPLRFLAALVTGTTATFLLLQLMREGQAEESPPPPPVRATQRAVLPEPTVTDTVLPPMPPPRVQRKSRSKLRDLLPVKNLGGY